MGIDFSNLIETWEEEAARLSDLGRVDLALRPVTITTAELKGLLIEIPLDSGETLVVVPTGNKHVGTESSKLPDGRYKRCSGHYDVVVVKSNVQSYPVGGHNLSMWESELRRGNIVKI